MLDLRHTGPQPLYECHARLHPHSHEADCVSSVSLGINLLKIPVKITNSLQIAS